MAKDFVLPIIDPCNPQGPRVNATIRGDLYLHCWKEDEIKYWNLVPARSVLDAPLLIFEGVRQFQQGGWCFAGRPVEYYLRPRVTVTLERERVFCVYLNPRLDVYEWRLEPADSPGSAYPSGHSTRFRRLAWRSTSSPTT